MLETCWPVTGINGSTIGAGVEVGLGTGTMGDVVVGEGIAGVGVVVGGNRDVPNAGTSNME